MRSPVWCLMLACVAAFFAACHKPPPPPPGALAQISPVLAFTNQVTKEGPWSIYIARVPRTAEIELHSVHAFNHALGLTNLSEQLRALRQDFGSVLVGINGDFYQRERAYAGDTRGLQILEGELISAPGGTASFWIDSAGLPHATNVQSLFTVTWANGKQTRIGLNEHCAPTNVVLFTPALGTSTKTTNATELVLEPAGSTPWLPLAVGQKISARVREKRRANSSLSNDVMVLAIGAKVLQKLGQIEAGQVLTISTATWPDVSGARTAISGGPLLIRDGKLLKIDPSGIFPKRSYAARSMWEEHPRSAIGWNSQFFYFVEVDGRQTNSIGMTLEQLRAYMLSLGCEEAMNMDGGGSATIWCNGAVVNRPCDGKERPIANALIATRRNLDSAKR